MQRRSVALGCVLSALGITIYMSGFFAYAREAGKIKTVVWESSVFNPSYEHLNPDGSMGGLAVEMGQAILRESPYELVFEKRGEVSLEGSALPYGSDALVRMGFETMAYQEQAVVSEVLFPCQWSAYSRPDVTQTLTWEGLDGYRLGVVGRQHPYYRLLAESYTSTQIFPHAEEAARALADGKIDLWITEKLTGYTVLATRNELAHVRYHRELEVADSVVLVFQEAQHGLVADINERIRVFKQTPVYRELTERYALDVYDKGNAPLQPVFWIVLSVFLASALVGMAWWWRRYRRLEGTLEQITDIYNENKDKLQIAVANAPNGLFVFKQESAPFFSQKARELMMMREVTPASMEALVTHMITVSHLSFHGLLIALQDKVLRQIPFTETLCVRLLREGEAECWLHLYVHAYSYQNRIMYTGYGQDVSKEKLLEQRLAFFEDHDYLTGLLNSRRLVQLGEQVLAQCGKTQAVFAVLFLDLYSFKEINHQYGQHYGDRLLQQVATHIQNILPDASLFARMGGDKFIILLSHTDSREEVLHIVLQIICGIKTIDCRALTLDANMGISFFPEHGDSVVHLITCAEKAADDAKEKGPGQYAVYRMQDAEP